LESTCLKDHSCKLLHNNWKRKCKAVTNWIDGPGPLPVCTEECKQANEVFLKHKIWKRSIDCHCGKFDDSISLNRIRKVERCFRHRRNLAGFCGTEQLLICPEGKTCYGMWCMFVFY